MPKLPRYQDSLAVTLSGTSNAQAQTAETRADTLDTFRKTLTDWAVNRQTQLGKISGAAATGPLKLKNSATAFGAAFNDAATRNYFIDHYIDSETELGRIEAESQSPQEFQTRATAVRQAALQGAVPQVKGGLRELYDKRIGEGVIRLQAKQIGEQKDLNRTLLDSGIDTVSGHISRLLGAQGDAALPQVQELEASAHALIESATNDGTLTPAEAVKKRLKLEQTTLRDYTQVRVRAALQSDPEAAERQLLTGGFPELNDDERYTWTQRAQQLADSERRRRLSDEDRAHTQAERAEKDAAEQAERDGLTLAAQGGLNASWIETNRNTLKPEALKYFYGQMRGQDVVTQNQIYAPLRERADRGDDVTADARAALYANQIKREDYDRLLGIVSNQGQVGWYKRGSQYIDRSLRPSDLNPDPAAQQRAARAMDDWYEWSRNNPQATEADASKESKRITDEYSMIDMKDFTLIKRAPTYLIGGRNAPNLDETEAATVKAYQGGQMDEAEFKRQAALIGEWRSAMDRMNARRAGASSGNQ